jgi:hypothetical protein
VHGSARPSVWVGGSVREDQHPATLTSAVPPVRSALSTCACTRSFSASKYGVKSSSSRLIPKLLHPPAPASSHRQPRRYARPACVYGRPMAAAAASSDGLFNRQPRNRVVSAPPPLPCPELPPSPLAMVTRASHTAAHPNVQITHATIRLWDSESLCVHPPAWLRQAGLGFGGVGWCEGRAGERLGFHPSPEKPTRITSTDTELSMGSCSAAIFCLSVVCPSLAVQYAR